MHLLTGRSRSLLPEQKHYDTLGEVLSGTVPSCDCNCKAGADYQPKATYTGMTDTEDKKNDCFLATDCIGAEKLASGEYNTNVFNFSEPAVSRIDTRTCPKYPPIGLIQTLIDGEQMRTIESSIMITRFPATASCSAFNLIATLLSLLLCAGLIKVRPT